MKKVLKSTIATLLIVMSSNVNAQFLRSSYFIEGSQYRMQLNPAFTPKNGYVNIPVLGNVNASVYSNSLGYNDVIDIIKNSDDADYFTSDKFMSNLKTNNNIGLSAGTDIAAAGWWHGKNFWSFNIGLKVDGGASVPKELFSFLRDMNGIESIDYTNYLRDMGRDKLNIGGRLKVLLGIGNLSLKVHDANVRTNLNGVDPNIDWNDASSSELSKISGTADINVNADLEYSFKGLDLVTNEDGYVEDFKFEGKNLGISGGGAAIDIGMSYRLNNKVTLSAALLDLGFIKWSKNSSAVAHANTNDLHFDSNNPNDINRFADIIGSNEVLNYDLLKLEIDPKETKSRTTSLATTFVIGGDYVINDMMSVGALFTERLSKPKSQTELTLSFNVHPKSFLDFTLSYSPIMCGGKSFGLAMKLGPVFLGTDYMFFGQGTRCCNALFGVSIPLGGAQKPL